MDYLSHYGVKGMKWGVRKEYVPKGRHPSAMQPVTQDHDHPSATPYGGKTRNKGSSPTKSPLSQKITSPFKKAGMMAAVGVHPSDIANPLKLFVKPDKDAPGDIIFRKGAVLQHIMATPDKDLNRHLFVAATPEDKANYAGFFAALSRYRNNNADMYKMELTAKEDIISPNKKKRVEEFIKLYENDKVNISKELAEFNKREYAGYFKDPVEKYTQEFMNMSMRDLKGKGFYTFYNSLFSSDYNRNAYFNQLKEQGYNAVVDDNDRRSFMQSKAPLIIFNAYDSLEKTKISELSMDEIRANMIEWGKMAHSDIDSNVYIAHYGVKGMKWGVRKARMPLTYRLGRKIKKSVGDLYYRQNRSQPVRAKPKSATVKRVFSPDEVSAEEFRKKYSNDTISKLNADRKRIKQNGTKKERLELKLREFAKEDAIWMVDNDLETKADFKNMVNEKLSKYKTKSERDKAFKKIYNDLVDEHYRYCLNDYSDQDFIDAVRDGEYDYSI